MTDHGRPIARIVPVERPTNVEQLRAQGRITPRADPKGNCRSRYRGADSVSDLIDDQRR